MSEETPTYVQYRFRFGVPVMDPGYERKRAFAAELKVLCEQYKMSPITYLSWDGYLEFQVVDAQDVGRRLREMERDENTY